VVAEIFLPATVDVQKVKMIAVKAVYASSYTYLNKPVEVIVINELINQHFVIKLKVISIQYIYNCKEYPD
jgi:hypothetical protein